MTSICPKCGHGFVEAATYCSACGANVASFKGQIYAKQSSVLSDDLTKKVKEWIHDPSVSKIILKDEKGVTLLEIPSHVGLVGPLLAPWLAGVGVVAALTAHSTVVVVRNVAPVVAA
jgi:hypothetical protein